MEEALPLDGGRGSVLYLGRGGILGDRSVCMYQNSFNCTLTICAFHHKFYLKKCRKWKDSGRTMPT